MSRYTGPRVRMMRALGTTLPGLSRKSIERRPHPPGQHGQRHRRRISDYGSQLLEKQKLRFNYGLGERQFRRLVKEAKASKVATGDKLVELLERRLDNVVFRCGYAATIPAARQLVNHGHISVNGRRVTIPSYRVRQGDELTLRARLHKNEFIQDSLNYPSLSRPAWLSVDVEACRAEVCGIPDAESVPFPVDIQLVVEYYSARI